MDAGLRLLPLPGYRRFLLRAERLIYPDGRGDCAELWRWESLREPHPAGAVPADEFSQSGRFDSDFDLAGALGKLQHGTHEGHQAGDACKKF
jgi:hypothetical protein